jgi:Leucine-rich repeat (LRR) protein
MAEKDGYGDTRNDIKAVVSRNLGKKGTLSLAPRIEAKMGPQDERSYNTISLSVNAYSPIGGIKPGTSRRKLRATLNKAPRNTLGIRMDVEDVRDYNLTSVIVPKFAPLSKYPSKELKGSSSSASAKSFKKFFLKTLDLPPIDLAFVEISDHNLLMACEDYYDSQQPKVEEQKQEDDARGDGGSQSPEPTETYVPPAKPDKRLTSLLLNNNNLTTVSALEGILGQVWGPNNVCLQWLDLSFNNLTRVEDALLNFKGLKLLNLNSNKIPAKKSEIAKIGQLKGLMTLSLIGNPVEEMKQYRWYTIATVQTLRKLDSACISPAERDFAKKTLKVSSSTASLRSRPRTR